MKNELTIYLDYSRTIARAKDLDEAAVLIRRQIDKMDDCCSEINASWDGEDSENYISKIRTIMSSLELTARNA